MSIMCAVQSVAAATRRRHRKCERTWTEKKESLNYCNIVIITKYDTLQFTFFIIIYIPRHKASAVR